MALLAQKRIVMKSGMNVALLMAGGLFFQGAIAQTAPLSDHERKADVAGANVQAVDFVKDDARDDRAVRGTTLSKQAPERSVAPGKNITITVPQIPVDQLGLGCAE